VIVVAEELPPEALDPFRRLGYPVAYDPSLAGDRPGLLARAGEAVALVVRNRVRVDAQLLEAAPRLRVVGRLGVGLDNVDLAAARRAGVPVVTAGDANAVAVAEYVFAALLHFARRLADADASVRSGRWDRLAWGGWELAGKTLGIVGLGRIGRRVAARARAFELTCLAFDPLLPPDDPAPAQLGVRRVELDELLSSSDFVTLHAPGGEGTRRLIGAPGARWWTRPPWPKPWPRAAWAGRPWTPGPWSPPPWATPSWPCPGSSTPPTWRA
jgi:phosphoglycerate dehydrogenase-like enzyme